jgi:ATP-binding cassette subfamily B (MDR/TAP) protein 1
MLGIQIAIYMFMIYAAYALAFWYPIHLFAKGEVESSGKVITTLFSIIIGTNAFAQRAGYIGSFLRMVTAGVELLKVIDEAPRTTPEDSRKSSAHSPTSSRSDGMVVRDENQDITFTTLHSLIP